MNGRSSYPSPKLYRSRDGIIFGVCGGLAEYFDWQPLGVRLITFFLMVFTFPVMLLVYLVLAMVLKKAPE